MHILNKVINKIGIQNLILVSFVFVVLMCMSLYQTFSLYTEDGGVSIIDNITTLNFILNADNTTNTISVASGTSKYLDITVSNKSATKLKYAIYYNQKYNNIDLTKEENFNISYLPKSKHAASGTINAGDNYVISVKIDNYTSNDVEVTLGVAYGFNNASDVNPPDGNSLLRMNALLSEMEQGDYIAYIGNNGCEGKLCEGQNANYESAINKGYCRISVKNDNGDYYSYRSVGWRIAYKDDDGGAVYLISAGAPECMCTGSDHNPSSSCSGSLSADDLEIHYNNMNKIAAKYCNASFVKGNECPGAGNINTEIMWAMGEEDFMKILGDNVVDYIRNDITLPDGFEFSVYHCKKTDEVTYCNFNSNSLINIGGYYSLVSPSTTTNNIYNWSPVHRAIIGNSTDVVNGIRPVLKLEGSIKVVGGKGTENNPYVIEPMSK